MGKKGRRCKTRWRRLPMGGEAEEEEEAALGGRERSKGGDGAASPLHNGPRTTAQHHAPIKGGVGGQRGGKASFGRRGGGAVTEGTRKGAAGGTAYTFNEDEYTKITTPRQDVLFKKGYLMARKKDIPVPSTNGTPSSTEATNGEVSTNGTNAPLNGDASSSSDQTYSAQVSGSGEDDSGGCNGYAYVNGYTNGYSYGGGYHMDHGAPNGGAYFVNGASYEIYDPYAAAATGYAFPYVGAPPPPPPPPHTLPPLHAMDWYASRPLGSTGNVGDVQWCHLVANPGYSETRRKRYSTDSQNCSPPSSESTGPPGSPQEEAASSGDHAQQPIPQYHHAHVFHQPAPAAAYVYPGYLFGPAVYSVNGVPFPPIHPLHGISQSIHVHPSAAVASTAVGPQGAAGVVPPAPGSDGGSQRRRKKKRRRKRRRGLTDEASEETSSEAGEEEGGACGGEEYDGEDGPVVVVRLGGVVPLVMSQPTASGTSQPYPEGEGGREASSTDCSELSGHPESSSGAEESVPALKLEDREIQVKKERLEEMGASRRDAELSAQKDILPSAIEEKDVSADAETKEVSTQSPPEMALQVTEPVTPPPSPVTPSRHTHVPEVSIEKVVIDNNQEYKEGKEKQLQKEETPRQKRRNGGRGRNNNKPPSQVAVAESEPAGAYIEKSEALEQSVPVQQEVKAEPVSSVKETIDIIPAPIEQLPLKQVPVKEKEIEIEALPVVPDLPESKEILPNSTPTILTEQRPEPPKVLELDTFTFKPEPYKHPMLKSPKLEKKEEPNLGEDNIVPEANGERTNAEEADEIKTEERLSPSRHLEDMPRRKSRLKKPPEKEETPGIANDVAEKSPEQEVRNSDEAERNDEEIDNKTQGYQDLPAEVIQQQGVEENSETPPETLTEMVSKWLEENSDALPESTEEINEKTEEEKAEEGNLTGSKNGVGNPFPVPSSRLMEEVTWNACEGVNVEGRVCASNASANGNSRDGPVKRVANRKIGKANECKDDYDEEGGRQLEDSEDSCEWEPMTVEAPKKNYNDLETWKRLRGGLAGSSEALRSLGSYRGTDDEEEDEKRKVRQSMCDPTSSVAKYYCLGGRDAKSTSPEESSLPAQIPVQTDSGVQSDAEEDSVATGEEALEENTVKGKAHRSVGLGKTAAFVVRQIGATESTKGPFPCGICCIIQ